MKADTIAKLFVVAVVFSMAIGTYLTFPSLIEVPEVPNPAGLNERGLQVRADVEERQARGFVQFINYVGWETLPEEVKEI